VRHTRSAVSIFHPGDCWIGWQWMASEIADHRVLYAVAVESHRGGQACARCGHARHTQRSYSAVLYAQPDVGLGHLWPLPRRRHGVTHRNLVAYHPGELRARQEQQINKEETINFKNNRSRRAAPQPFQPRASRPPLLSGRASATLPPPSTAPIPPASRGSGSSTCPAVLSRPAHAAHAPPRVARGGCTGASRGGRPSHRRRHIAWRPLSGRRSTRQVAPARLTRRRPVPAAVRP